jgi:hypothetical protein
MARADMESVHRYYQDAKAAERAREKADLGLQP